MTAVNLHELFARDPRKHTDQDIELLIAGMREMRSKFILSGTRAGPKPKELTGVAKLSLDVEL